MMQLKCSAIAELQARLQLILPRSYRQRIAYVAHVENYIFSSCLRSGPCIIQR